MKLFGGILPFIGWRHMYLDYDSQPCEKECARWFADVFEIEWFGCGVALYMGKVYPHERD